MSGARIAIVGSCVTRDLWPPGDAAPSSLLYISRTSLPSLISPRPDQIVTHDAPPPGLKLYQHRALKADIEKSALEALMIARPTHIVFDFIDERFDLLRYGQGIISRSWELTASGYLDAAPPGDLIRVPRLSAGCQRMWSDALASVAGLIATSPLRSAAVILHSSRWAEVFRDAEGEVRAFPPSVEILPGEDALIADHNALLERYEAAFLSAFPRAAVVSSPHRVASETHRWGLSPFHFIDAYYSDIRSQLAGLGVTAD